jgi:hypothetical protein
LGTGARQPNCLEMPFEMWDFLIDPLSVTGFTAEILEDIFLKYCGRSTPIKNRKHLAVFLEWCMCYRTVRSSASSRGLKSYRNVHVAVRKAIDYLFKVVNELEYAFLSRLDVDNAIHTAFENMNRSTCLLDSFPIYINRPSRNQGLFYNGKYKRHILKVQALVDHRGNLIWFSGPHVGCQHDVSLFYEHHPVLMPGETILADKAYVGARAAALGVLAPIKSRRSGPLSAQERDFNGIHTRHRSRVEHAFGYLKRFGIMSNRYRGRVIGESHPNICKVTKILIHLNYMRTRKYPLRSTQ